MESGGAWWTQEGKGCSSSWGCVMKASLPITSSRLPTSGRAAFCEAGINAVNKTQKQKEGNMEPQRGNGSFASRQEYIPAPHASSPAKRRPGQARSLCHNILQFPVPAAQGDICTLAFRNTFPWPALCSPCRHGYSQRSRSGFPQQRSLQLQQSSPTSELIQIVTS